MQVIVEKLDTSKRTLRIKLSNGTVLEKGRGYTFVSPTPKTPMSIRVISTQVSGKYVNNYWLDIPSLDVSTLLAVKGPSTTLLNLDCTFQHGHLIRGYRLLNSLFEPNHE